MTITQRLYVFVLLSIFLIAPALSCHIIEIYPQFFGNSGAVFNSNGVAFVAQGVWADKIGVSEILIFNGTDPQNLFLVNVQSLTYSPTSLAISSDDSYLYISSTNCLLQVMDVSNPQLPVLLTTPDSSLAYYGYQIALSPDETVAYVASSSGIFGIDIQQPKVPLRLFQLKMKAGGVRVSADGNYIYVLNQTSSDGGLTVISVGNNTEPSIKANLNTGYGYSLAASADSQYLYLLRVSSLVVIDISIPNFPQLLTSLDLPASVPYDVQVIFSQIMMYENNLLFLAFNTQVLIVNVTVSHNPEYVATFLSAVPLSVISGDTNYYLGLSAVQGIVTFDFESANNWNASVVIPTNVQTTACDATSVSTNANQTLLFTTDFNNGLIIYDISQVMKSMHHRKEHHHGDHRDEDADPTAFDLLGVVQITNASTILYCEQRDLVIVGNNYLLTIVNVSDPNNPSAVGYLTTAPSGMDFSSDCNTLYLGIAQSFDAWNISDITGPNIIGQYQQLNGFNSVTVNAAGTYAFTCANSKNFQVLDISNLTSVTTVFTSNVTVVPSCTTLAVTPDENYVIILTKLGMVIYDVSDPTVPVIVDSYTSLEAGNFLSVSPEGDYIAISTQTQVVLFNMQDIENPFRIGAYDSAGLIHGIQLMESGTEIYIAADNIGVQIITVGNVNCVETSSIVGPFVYVTTGTTGPVTTTGSTTDNDSSSNTTGEKIVVTIVEAAVAVVATGVGVSLIALGVFLYVRRRKEFMSRRRDGYGIISNVAKEDIESSSSSNKYKNKFGTVIEKKTPETADIVGPYSQTPISPSPVNFKRQEAVIKRATKNLSKDSKNPTELEKRAVALMHIGKFELAIEDSTKVLAMDSNNKTAYFVRAYCFMRLHDASRAMLDCEQFVNLTNSSLKLVVNNNYAINESMSSMPQLPSHNSLKVLKKKNLEDETDNINYDNEIHFVMGSCLQYLRKFEQAIKELQLYIGNETPDSKSLWINEAKERIEFCQQELNVIEFNEKSLEFQTEEIEEGKVIGKGEFGIVFMCKNRKNGGVYAAKKVMLSSLSQIDQRRILIQKLEGEIDILKRMKHPNIVQLVACSKSVEGNFTLYMDLYDNNLGAIINEKTLQWQSNKNMWFTPKELKLFCVDILSGVAYLHANKIAHRDLKSDNILVRVKTSRNVVSLHVADFGMSKIFGGAETLLATTVSGTLSFMAPEVAQGWYEGKNSQYDPFKADIWSFGMVLFELLSPGMRATATPRDILIGKVPSLPPSIAEKPEFQIFVCMYQDCTVLDPKKRPTARQLLEIISQYDPTK